MNRGITLIETVLYLALLSILLATALPLLIDLNQWQSKQEITANSFRDYLFVETKIRSLLMNASDIVIPAMDETSETLVVDIDEGENEQRVIIRQNSTGNSIIFEVEGESIEFLVSTSTRVSDMYFSRTPGKISFALSINNSSFGTSTYIYDSE